MMPTESYIGDGLFASFDGYQIKLRAPRENGDHEVYLEPQAFAELVRFAYETSGAFAAACRTKSAA